MRLRILLVAALAFGACGDDDDDDNGGNTLDGSVSDAQAPQDGTVPDASVDSSTPVQPSDCFLNPTTYTEIINACTDAEKVVKNPVLPLLRPDGTLPPLP